MNFEGKWDPLTRMPSMRFCRSALEPLELNLKITLKNKKKKSLLWIR